MDTHFGTFGREVSCNMAPQERNPFPAAGKHVRSSLLLTASILAGALVFPGCVGAKLENSSVGTDAGPRPKTEPVQLISDEVTTEGDVSADKASSIALRHWGELKYCYDQHRAKGGKLRPGKMTFALETAPSGEISSVSLTVDEVQEQELRECVSGMMRRWRFPQGSSRIVLPIMFNTP